MKRSFILLVATVILIFGCFKQSNEGYLEVVNHSTASIYISGFDQESETIASGDTSKLYTFDLGQDPYRWYNIGVGGYYFTTLAWWYYNTPYWGYSEDVCIHDGNKTTLNIYDYHVESSVKIINHTTSTLTGFLKFHRQDLSWYIPAGGWGRWDLNVPIDRSFSFDFRIYEPYLIDTVVVVQGGEHLDVNIYPQ